MHTNITCFEGWPHLLPCIQHAVVLHESEEAHLTTFTIQAPLCMLSTCCNVVLKLEQLYRWVTQVWITAFLLNHDRDRMLLSNAGNFKVCFDDAFRSLDIYKPCPTSSCKCTGIGTMSTGFGLKGFSAGFSDCVGRCACDAPSLDQCHQVCYRLCGLYIDH